MDRKGVSLSGEIDVLVKAVDGVRELAERLNESTFDDSGVSLQIAANLSIIEERLRLLEKAVRGAVDPRLLWSTENNAFPVHEADGGDIVLRVWSDKEAAKHHRHEWRRAKRRLRSEAG